MRVFVTGGTGLIGVRLVRALRKRGDDAVVLTRRENAWERIGPDVTIVVGDGMIPGPWQDQAAECDAVVNLAGAGIFDHRWTSDYKQLISDSRVKTSENVAAALMKQPMRADGSPKALVNGSAIGYYGACGDERLSEDGPPGDDYLARRTVDWEAAAKVAESAGIRVTMIRTGVVLDPAGGPLGKLLPPFKLGLGGPIGSGMQYMSWIHYADEIGIILLALDNPDARGPINAAAPEPVTNREFAKALGHALGRPTFLRTPAFAVRMALGEVAGVVTTGQRVVPARALELGYVFQFPELKGALRNILNEH